MRILWPIALVLLLSGCLCLPSPSVDSTGTEETVTTTIKPSSLEDCTKLQARPDKDACYMKRAAAGFEPALCDKVMDAQTKIICKAGVAGEGSGCDKMSDNGDRAVCRAAAAQDAGQCGRLKEPDRNRCYLTVAVFTQDPGDCDMAAERMTRIRCYRALGACGSMAAADREICDNRNRE
jgi:hypothetical protein